MTMSFSRISLISTLILSYLIIIILYSTSEKAGTHFRQPLPDSAKVTNTHKLPRRPSNYTLRRRQLRVREVPSWESCPPAQSSSAIWSMAASKAEARYSAVLGMSILETWDYSRTVPDLRLIVITPTVLDRRSLVRLEEIGWGICFIKRLDYLMFGESKYRDSFGKLHVWNMTQYERLVWVDSDSLAVSSLHPLLDLADRLEEPGSERPGPRIGASYDGEWWDSVIYKGETPAAGSVRDDINTGVFLIKPGGFTLNFPPVFIPSLDGEEYLHLLNLKKMKSVRVRQSVGGEQGWLNEVYLWEKFDIGLEFNVRTGVMQVRYNSPLYLSFIRNISNVEKRNERLYGECDYFPLCLAVQA